MVKVTKKVTKMMLIFGEYLESLEKPDCRARVRDRQQSWKWTVITLVLLVILVMMSLV